MPAALLAGGLDALGWGSEVGFAEVVRSSGVLVCEEAGGLSPSGAGLVVGDGCVCFGELDPVFVESFDVPVAGSRDDVAVGRGLFRISADLFGEPDEALDGDFVRELAGRAVFDVLVALELLVSGKSDSGQSNSELVWGKSCDCAPLLEFAEHATPGVFRFVVFRAVVVEADVLLVRSLEEELREGVRGEEGPCPVGDVWVPDEG
jgi:hypothetical protein